MKTNMTMASIAFISIMAAGCGLGFAGPERVADSRDYSMQAAEIDKLKIEAVEGDLIATGSPDVDSIEVTIELVTHDTRTDDDAEASRRLRTSLRQRAGVVAELEVDFDRSFALNNPLEGYRANITVTYPSRLEVAVDDGSGHIYLSEAASVSLHDASGDAEISAVNGDVNVRDGAGGLVIFDVDGDVNIVDGAGEIEVRDVSGIVTVSDGSGSILVENVGYFDLLNDGAGDVTVR